MKNDDVFRSFFAEQAQPLQRNPWFARRVANRLPQRGESRARRIEAVLWCLAWVVGLLADGWLVGSLMPLSGFGPLLTGANIAAGITALSVWGVLIGQLVKMLRA